ncbi:PAS domain-containing protein [Zhouia amylolytica]|uniref:histidine kinase n=1 Tax=Zhouia amylolytica TaxID=376730 RepID=A0A1I6QT70_9FLAO|nr:ATP-binding protein [Zhouia amylolytica]SFS55641.1 PAS domain-containing protein [Zhouia amylolytica]
MTLKWRYRLYHGVVFSMFTALVIYTFHDRLLYLMIAEIMVFVLIVLSFYLFKSLFLPIEQINLGIDTIKDQDFTVKISETGMKEVDEMIKVYNSLIENIRNERRFQKEQHFFLSQLLESLPIGVLILDYDDQIAEYNPAASKFFNLEKTDIGAPISKVLPFVNSTEATTTFPIKRYQNNYYRVIANTFVHKGFHRKIIMLEEVSKEVFAIEKKAYDKVIRMMAHEVKNSVGAVNSILEELKNDLDTEEANLLEISVRRNKALNQFINNFARVVRIPEAHKEPIELGTWIEEVLILMKPKAEAKGVSMRFINPGLKVYQYIDATLLEQVLINVLLNAIDASENAAQKEVKVELTKNQLIVTDFGIGIPEELQKELFTPFFTTKPKGQGIGLTMVRDILEKHGFQYRLSSDNGATRFQIKF